MPSFLFYIFAIIMLGFAVGVVVNRNPVASALCLVASFVGLAALYISLNAFFLGTIQILVYAGAVMVLFLFIIMLLDIKAEERKKVNWGTVSWAGLMLVLLISSVGMVLSQFPLAQKSLADVPLLEDYSDVAEIGKVLFTKYTFHLQVVGVLLLVATVGVVSLSRREDKSASAPN
jgi:NADH-quinone oxidoreductase subunit J